MRQADCGSLSEDEIAGYGSGLDRRGSGGRGFGSPSGNNVDWRRKRVNDDARGGGEVEGVFPGVRAGCGRGFASGL